MATTHATELRRIFSRHKRNELGIQAFVAEVTPSMATELLGRNANVRKLRDSVVMRYATDMMMGGWTVTGEPIIFDEDGNGVNGQHRLHACILADVPFTTLVVLGVAAKADLSMDTGAKRTLGDYLQHYGHTDAKNLAAAIRLAYQLIEEGEVTQSAAYTNEILLRWFIPAHVGLVEDLIAVRLWERHWPKGFTRSHAAAIRHAGNLAGVELDRLDGFFAALAYAGDIVDTRSPTHVLHQYFVRAAGSDRDRIQLPARMALTIKALNLYVAGDEATPRALLWRSRDRREPFPKISPGVLEETARELETR